MDVSSMVLTKELIPIFTVVLAWWLARFTNVFEWKRDQINKIGQVLVYLRLIRRDLSLSIGMLLDADDCLQYEVSRVGISRRSFVMSRDVNCDIGKYTSILCYISPGLAERFAVTIRDIFGLLDSKVVEISKIDGVIAKVLNDSRTVFLNVKLDDVDIMILHVAWGCGTFEFIRSVYRIGFLKSIKLLFHLGESESSVKLKNMLRNPDVVIALGKMRTFVKDGFDSEEVPSSPSPTP